MRPRVCTSCTSSLTSPFMFCMAVNVFSDTMAMYPTPPAVSATTYVGVTSVSIPLMYSNIAF